MIVGAIINIALLFVVARRLLGVPVGWGRVVIISTLVYLAASPLLETLWAGLHIDERRPALPVVLVVLVIGGCLIAGELVVLAVLEALLPTRSVPTATSLVTGFPAAVRRTRRYLEIWWIGVRRGLTAYLGPAPRSADETSRAARSLRRGLTDAGVTFVKFGQMLATRADLLPGPFVQELSKLHSQVEAEPWEAVRPVVEESLSAPLDEVFADLDTTPLAAASVAQIHAARLADGTAVFVKVQRPRARSQVTADLDILRRIASRLERQTDWGRRIGAVALVEGFAASLHEELDYRVEVANMRGVGAASDLIVPKVHTDLSSERVIVMQRIAGLPLSSAAAELGRLTDAERAELAERLLSQVLRQIFVHGVFHADLHPGNVILTEDDDLALLDFGSVGRLDRPTRNALVLLLYAVDRQDSIAATDTLIDLLDRPADLDDRELERDLGRIILRLGDGAGASGALFTDLLDVVVRHGFRVPPQLAAVFRTMATLDGTLRLIDDDIDLIGVARLHSADIARTLVGREAAQEQLTHQLATLLPVLARLPRRISRIGEQLEDGTLTVNVRPFSAAADRAYLSGVGGQVNLTLLACAAGSSSSPASRAPSWQPGSGCGRSSARPCCSAD
ncbi:ABC1 kinase family protein [Tessaracoccus defluvii]|uniref:AarF/ABC1/UbiB kinase family protein n=1 Tax=Tessaracoccus defluvii TaxID=1285901 RepID=A0A7H0H3S3_9ACTN|nr:AarF/UbiB family protein [Tessaracoccus defluvii]QNP55189.1 AarF/ABC1/UbiB kinase family protein [Tessaracoccus defluvii]